MKTFLKQLTALVMGKRYPFTFDVVFEELAERQFAIDHEYFFGGDGFLIPFYALDRHFVLGECWPKPLLTTDPGEMDAGRRDMNPDMVSHAIMKVDRRLGKSGRWEIYGKLRPTGRKRDIILKNHTGRNAFKKMIFARRTVRIVPVGPRTLVTYDYLDSR